MTIGQYRKTRMTKIPIVAVDLGVTMPPIGSRTDVTILVNGEKQYGFST